MGLKRRPPCRARRKTATFSRTPRGFEAALRRARTGSRSLSAEPLVGLKQMQVHSENGHPVLSAEPLVGLKRRGAARSWSHRHRLSAEPLVGLKRSPGITPDSSSPFSRTPRGFEAT